MNSELVSLARTQGSVSVNGEYRFQLSQDVGAMQLIACLDALGSVGYYKGGPDIAIKGLLDNQIEALLTSGQQYLDHQHQLFTKFVESSALSVTGELEWFNLTDSFGEVGVKTVGLLCNYLLEQQVASGAHYLAGFQYICDQIPGMGPVEFNQSKLSMRIPHALRPAVESGDLPSLDQLLPAVAGAAGGFVDACHPYAAAVTVGRGAEETFIERLNSALLSYLSLGSE